MTDKSDRKLYPRSSSTGDIKIKIKPPISKNSTIYRRSRRRRTAVLSSLGTNSSSSTIFQENGSGTESTVDKDDDDQETELLASLGPDNKLVFTTVTTTPSIPKSSYWTVTDRQPEWYRLSIPANQSIFNKKSDIVPYKKLPKLFQRDKSKIRNEDQIDQPSDPMQLVMKTVMHELDYDMDDDDFKFLKEMNQKNKSKQKREISEEEFENAILILEFSTAEKIRSYVKQRSCDDHNIVCDICLLPDGDDGNEMVFCERCNCCVHQKCYGIPSIPSGTWLCKPCSILRRPSCILCPRLGGPMKCTASGTIWCHLTCVLWLPELKFVDYVNMEPILHLNKIPHARWSLRCVVCSTSEGACVQCAHKSCRTPFHVTCGLAAGYFLDIQQISTKEPNTFRSQFNAYCFKHSDEARKRAEEDDELSKSSTNKDSDDDDDDDDSSCSSTQSTTIPFTVYRRDQLKNEKWIKEYYKRFSTFVSSTHLNEECSDEYDETVSKEIYEYWIKKRQQNNSMPLIKYIDLVFEQRESADLLIAQINSCLSLRQQMLQLQTRCKSMVDSSSSSSSSILVQRLESLKSTFSKPIRRGRGRPPHRHSSTHENKRKDKNKTKLLKRTRQKVSHSNKRFRTVESVSRDCIVKLESTYRHSLELDTTYIIGKTNDGQTVLLPKKLIEQENLVTLADNLIPRRLKTDSASSTNESDISDNGKTSDDEKLCKKKKIFNTTKTAYTSQGNVVTCVTGSFN